MLGFWLHFHPHEPLVRSGAILLVWKGVSDLINLSQRVGHHTDIDGRSLYQLGILELCSCLLFQVPDAFICRSIIKLALTPQ